MTEGLTVREMMESRPPIQAAGDAQAEQQLLTIKARVLERAMLGSPLAATLEMLCVGIESVASRDLLLASVMLLDRDGTTLRYGAGPSLPLGYRQVMDGMAVGLCAASCGTAAYRRKAIAVADLATDPLWAAYRDMALRHGLRACWSTPIISPARAVLGTFALYSRRPQAPSPWHQRVSEVAVQIAALLIERDRTERSRRESEQRLTLAVHGARLATWEWDLARDQVTVSHPFESASGFPLAAFQGSCEAFIQTVLPVDRDGVALALARARRERDDFDVSFRVKASHDEVRWIAIKGVVSRDAARLPIRLVGLAMDMNAWKVVESPEESPYAQFRTITDVSADGVIILQDGVHIAYINAAALNLLGAPQPEDVLQKPLLAIVHPDAHGAIREQVQRLLNQGQPIALPDARYVRLDGSSFHAEMAGFLLGSHNGQALCLVLHDRTQRKRLDMQLRQAAKMETVARLAAGIAHDFNNLLTIILGCSNELLTRFAPQDRVYVYAQDISRAAEQASTLTNQLLAFSRQQVARHQAVDLNELVTRLGTTLRSLLGEQSQLITILDPALRLTKADPAQLERILINLIMNARDAMPNGGTVYVQTGNGEFEAQEINDAGMGEPRPAVCLEVHDTGHGMDEDTQAHLFEPFFTTKGLGYGRGLGLASVYGIVMQHGGTIVAHSVPDHGSTFRIALPAHETSTDYASPASAQRSGAAGSETILLVEDDAGVRGFLQRLLASRGYHVLEAGDGPAALQHCTSTSDPVHLLLTDVMMPGMTGPQLADKLKGISPATRVIYMSGYTDETVASGWRDSLPAAFLHKPFLPDVLLETVRRVLDQPE